MNIFGDPQSFQIICSLSTSLMLFTKRCQDYYYPISCLISMVKYNVKRSILAIFLIGLHLIATKHRMILTPLVIYGATHLKVTCNQMQLFVHDQKQLPNNIHTIYNCNAINKQHIDNFCNYDAINKQHICNFCTYNVFNK